MFDPQLSFPLNYAPFQRNGAANDVVIEHVKQQSKFGEVSEWLKEHAWKVCIRQRIEGSNPSLTAKL